MSDALKLVPASQNRAGGDWSPDDYDVVLANTGETVGRIYARLAPGGREWFWALGFPYTLNAWKPFYGTAESKEAAERAFAERWGVASGYEKSLDYGGPNTSWPSLVLTAAAAGVIIAILLGLW